MPCVYSPGSPNDRPSHYTITPDGGRVTPEWQILKRKDRTMRVLLGSGGFRTPERVAVLAGQMRAFFGGVRRLLFVPYALADHDGYLKGIEERGLYAGYELDGL